MGVYDPARVRRALIEEGFRVTQSGPTVSAEGEEESVVDVEAEMAERALRMFMRATHINDVVFRQSSAPTATSRCTGSPVARVHGPSLV